MARVRGDRQVYTPQAVVDGVVHAVGSNSRGHRHRREDVRRRMAR